MSLADSTAKKIGSKKSSKPKTTNVPLNFTNLIFFQNLLNRYLSVSINSWLARSDLSNNSSYLDFQYKVMSSDYMLILGSINYKLQKSELYYRNILKNTNTLFRECVCLPKICKKYSLCTAL